MVGPAPHRQLSKRAGLGTPGRLHYPGKVGDCYVGMLSSLLLIFDGVIICYIVNQITSRQEEKALYISGDN